ncbi:hypothetical protein [Wolbachia endosymbiont (group A) of Gastracanthus pulcherrimus]|uniref:hypothetical protein n=1 Tax=Wolbachia endosymbiont (group A) of Gastracanthus pulcherrimus TaxID=3066200 RepID=UPI003340F10E
MLRGSVFDEIAKKTRSQCLGTGRTGRGGTGIQGHIDRCRQFVIPLRVSGI